MRPPTFDDVLAARDLLSSRLPATPQWSYPALDEAAGASVVVKHENVQPTGAFKVRGGLTLLAGLAPERRRRGLVTYSTGNHAQSIAYACAEYDAPCTVVMPETASEEKVRATRGYGARVLLSGADMAGAQKAAEALADEFLLVSPGDTAALMAGVGTAYLELLEACPDLDAVVVPVGSGTGAAGACLVAAAVAPHCRVIAVQSASSPAAHDSWRAGDTVERPNRTAVEGLATGRGFTLPQSLLRAGLAEFRLVSDEQIRAAQRVLATHAHTLAEGAGAAALAAVLAAPDDFAGRRVAVVCTGGNASRSEIAALA
ncbi:pyridoxal-phosphate dependent enzyme [Actinomadura logoneensis]|uniref:threonine ammonia-lyase n=1 Tax=Actinomadura logoneensis TaxID=2293572 RepID=A0A372JKD4_9ACTN|nr:pyridoxal-phosphate dependent enzyme [Actinomadura logoneensis]RFU40304.1 pyridoxal-phosphate dependent enzyme [Actinomadura logoneensis]